MIVHTTTRDINLPDPIDPNYRQGNPVTEKKNERDELARVIASNHTNAAVDAILADYSRKPRTIETVEELDALAEGSIILETCGVASRAVKRQDGKNWWIDGPRSMSASELIPLPATVLYEPGAGE